MLMNTSAFAVTGPGQFHIRTFDTAQTGGWRDKKQAEEQLRRTSSAWPPFRTGFMHRTAKRCC